MKRPPGWVPEIYRCPKCSEPMVLGHLVLDSSTWSFFAVGFSLSKLDFVRSDEQPMRLLEQGGTRTAYKCKACEIIAITPR